MKIKSNLEELRHRYIESYIITVDSLPLRFHYLHEYFCKDSQSLKAKLEYYKLIKFELINEVLILEYINSVPVMEETQKHDQQKLF